MSTSHLPRRSFLRLAGAGAAGLWLTPTGVSALAPPATRRVSEETKSLVVRTESPLNAEGQLHTLPQASLTPHQHFYVRSNGPVPKIKAEDFRLTVEGLVEKPLTLSLAELADKFRPRTIAATLMCAGNRRREHSAVKKVGGVQWDAGAIGNAEWTGVSLAEVLRAPGLKPEAKHVWFESLDEVVEEGKTIHFGGSIPLVKALAADGDLPGAILAHSMHEKPLPPEHGFPLRAVVPGFIGSRSVKWLGKIVLADRPSDNYFVARSYKIVQKGDVAELAATEPIYEFPITSAMCFPTAQAEVDAGKVIMGGYALAPGRAGLTIAKVEVSADGGKSWTAADFTSRAIPFCWRLWRIELDLAAGPHELVVRAVDSKGNIQPERPDWNQKGYLYNGWHRVNVTAV